MNPFSTRLPGLAVDEALAGYSYAFNFEQPAGVKLLGERAFARLTQLIGDTNAVPDLQLIQQSEDEILYDHGLVKVKSRYGSTNKAANSDMSLNVWLNVSDACNLGCFYCYIPDLNKHVDAGDLKLSQYNLDQGKGHEICSALVLYCQTKRITHLHIKFAGGEPTLAIATVEAFCSHLKTIAGNLRITFGMLTNGVFDPLAVLPTLANHRIQVSISLDGIRDTHDNIRFTRANGCRIGTWERITNNVALLIEAGIRPYFLFTVTEKNFRHIGEFSTFVHNIGCGFRLSLERGRRSIDFQTQLEMAEHLSSLYKALAYSTPTDLRFDRDAKFAEWNLHKRKNLSCSTCRGYIAVGKDGDVSSCQMRLNEPVGNLIKSPLEATFDRFLSDPGTAFLAQPGLRSGACSRCEYRFVCAGGCPQHTRNVKGEFDSPSPWCYVYGSLLPIYFQSNAIHLARRALALRGLIASRAAAISV